MSEVSLYCTHKTVKPGFWPWLSSKSPYNVSSRSLFARKRNPGNYKRFKFFFLAENWLQWQVEGSCLTFRKRYRREATRFTIFYLFYRLGGSSPLLTDDGWLAENWLEWQAEGSCSTFQRCSCPRRPTPNATNSSRCAFSPLPPETHTSQPETRNSKPEARNLEPAILNPKPETINPKSKTRNPEP